MTEHEDNDERIRILGEQVEQLHREIARLLAEYAAKCEEPPIGPRRAEPVPDVVSLPQE